MMDVNLSKDTLANTEIFSGKDGILYANIDGGGKLGYTKRISECNDKKEDKQVNNTKTNDPFIIMPYTILVLCAIGAYITIKEFDYK